MQINYIYNKRMINGKAIPVQRGPLPITLQLTWAGKSYKITTSNERPPIQSIVEIRNNLIEIHYATGEAENAKSYGYEGDFIVAGLFDEFMRGKPAAIKKFSWAA